MNDEVPCGIRHVDLDGPRADLTRTDGESTLLAVFHRDGFVLGRRLFSKGELPVPAAALADIGAAAIADALAERDGVDGLDRAGTLAAWITAQSAQLTDPVSVIVCTRDRPESLKRCLASIARCDPPPAEIVVVDNAPAAGGVRAIVEGVPGAVYVFEPRPGLSRARNAGMAAARGDIFAFTDDDAEVRPNWLAPIRAALLDPAVGCVTGQVVPASLREPAAFSFEFDFDGLSPSNVPARFDAGFLRQTWRRAPPVWQIGAGANMAIRRELVEQVGPFDERLGAGAAGCSEDSEFFHRALCAGWTCQYEPLAVAFHHHRRSLRALRNQIRAYMRGHVTALFVQFAQTRHPGNLLRVIVVLPRHFALLGLRLILAPIGLRRRIYPWEVLGFLEGPFAWLRLCRKPKYQTPDPTGHEGESGRA